jgi:hypothetical protein
MTPIGQSDKTSIEALRTAIQMLTNLDRRWRNSGQKRALYRYLTAVFNLYAAGKRAGAARTVANRIARLARLSVQHDRHVIRTIIDASSSADRRSKSRWYRALRYAWRERGQWLSLNECLRANGGIAGCASRWADLQAGLRTPDGFVRIGGESRFPKIPFFVSATLLDRYGDYL